MLAGMLFLLSWNPVPTYLEQGSILVAPKRELKKLTTRAYRAENEKWRLENRRDSCWLCEAVE